MQARVMARKDCQAVKRAHTLFVLLLVAVLAGPTIACAQPSHPHTTSVGDAYGTTAARAAMEDVDVREMMSANPLMAYVLFDRLEMQDADSGGVLVWDMEMWTGRALGFDRLWIRSEGDRASGRTERAGLEVLWGRAFAPWWDFVAGVRQDSNPGPSRTWAAVGVQGTAPYRFDVQATAYLTEAGQAGARLEAEYALLITNRLILQPRIEVGWFAEDDSERGIASGFAQGEIGLRLRYEIRREIAPYVGIEARRKLGDTADFARAAGKDPDETRLVAGIRVWF